MTFPSMCCFSQFGDAYPRRLPMGCVIVQEWQATFVEVWHLYPEELKGCCESEQWILLRIICIVGTYRCTQYVKVEEDKTAQPWFLETYRRGLWGIPHRRHRTPWPAGVGAYENTDLLVYCLKVKGVHLLTPPSRLPLYPETRDWVPTGSTQKSGGQLKLRAWEQVDSVQRETKEYLIKDWQLWVSVKIETFLECIGNW